MAVISKEFQGQVKLDLYDKKIIFYLSQNSRMPISEIAKKLSISSQRVQYKIDRLKQEVLEPAAFMNFPLLDIPSFIIYTQQLDDNTIEQLMESKEIYFLMQSLGKYQWVINVVTEDIELFCKEYLSDKHFEIYPIIKSIPDDYNPFNLSIKPNLLKKDQKKQLDTKDYQILKHIAKNPLDSLINIQSKLEIDRKTIKSRIKQFEDNNIIQKFRYGINIFKIGCIAYILKIEVIPKNKQRILEEIRQNNFSGFIFESYNNFTMHYLPPSHNEIREFTKYLESIDPTIKIDVIQNTEFFKVKLVPEIVGEIFEKRSKPNL